MSAYKPGTVVMASRKGENESVALVIKDGAGSILEWSDASAIELGDEYSSRPLLVLDPEDAEQMDQFAKKLVEQMYPAGVKRSAANGCHPATITATVRTLLAPKPAEPQGLGAAVRCQYDGRQGTAVYTGAGWTFYGEHLVDHGAEWHAFDAVEVLSEGVTA